MADQKTRKETAYEHQLRATLETAIETSSMLAFHASGRDVIEARITGMTEPLFHDGMISFQLHGWVEARTPRGGERAEQPAERKTWRIDVPPLGTSTAMQPILTMFAAMGLHPITDPEKLVAQIGPAGVFWAYDLDEPLWGEVSGMEIHKAGVQTMLLMLVPQAGALGELLLARIDAYAAKKLADSVAELYAGMTEEQKRSRVVSLAGKIGGVAVVDVERIEEGKKVTMGDVRRQAVPLIDMLKLPQMG
jgi:hypothetical protein